MLSDEFVFNSIKEDNCSDIENLLSSGHNLENGINVKNENKILLSKPSPLLIACFFSSIKIIKFLLANSVSLFVCDLSKVLFKNF